MSLIRFPMATAAADDWSPRPDASAETGTILVVTAPDQGTLPNLGLSGLRAAFADAAGTWPDAADLILVCAGARSAAQFKGNLTQAQKHGTPVIVWGDLTIDERIAMLEAGVQDVIAPDCHPQEFQARIQTHLRRRGAASRMSWRLTMMSRSLVAPDGKIVHFSPGLTQLLRMLLEAKGEVVKREDLASAFYETLTNRALDAQVCRLRRKLRQHGCRMLLQGVKGLGYSLLLLDEPVIIE